MANTKPEGGLEDAPDADMGMMEAAEDLIKAIHSKNAQGVVDALKAAMDMGGGSDVGSPEDFLAPVEWST